MEKQDVVHDTLLGLLAEIVLDRAVRSFREQNLYEEIDKALATGDESRFMKLTNELKDLHHQL